MIEEPKSSLSLCGLGGLVFAIVSSLHSFISTLFTFETSIFLSPLSLNHDPQDMIEQNVHKCDSVLAKCFPRKVK